MKTPAERIAPPELTLDAVVAWNAEWQADAVALELPGLSAVTWQMFDGGVSHCARVLAEDFDAGQCIGIVCDDSLAFHVLVNAAWRAGLAVLLVSRTWGDEVIGDLVRLASARRLYGDPSYNRLGSVPVSPIPTVQTASERFASRASLDHVAMLASTSGTTDDPKCVAIRHGQIRAAYRSALSMHDLSGVKRAASLFPLNGLGVMGVCFLFPREVGAGTRVYPAFSLSNIQTTWMDVLEVADFVYLVPTLVRLLVSLPELHLARKPLLTFCAAAPVAREELQRLEARFPIVTYNCYGLTELTFAVFFGAREPDGHASGTIGLAPSGVSARLVSISGEDIVGEGDGELLLKGPMLTEGYLKNPSATTLNWCDGWFRTGDLARRDALGRYTIHGRAKETVIRGGVLTYLHELEHYMRRAPGAIDVCAFRGRDMPSGDELCAVVHAQVGTTREELVIWVRQNLGRDKVPNVLFVWNRELPRNSSGKVLRSELARLYRAGELA